MTASSARGPSESDEDPAWSRPDPMTAEEREAWLDHLAETDEPPEEEEDCEDFAPLTAEEPAEAREGAAAGPALWAGLAGHRVLASPPRRGSARVNRMMSCSGYWPPGTGWRRTWPPGSWPRPPS
jgi:hypothetical protein